MNEVFHVQQRVEFRDTDAAGIVHFSVFFVYMEQAEHAFLRHLGFSVMEYTAGSLFSWPRVAATCDYRSAARFEDVLDVKVSVVHLGTKSVRYSFQFRVQDRLVAEGTTTAAYCLVRDDHTMSAVPITDSLRTALQRFLAST